MTTSRTHLIVMAKAPVPGFAKTRLIPALGADGAAQLAARLLEHTLTMLGPFDKLRSFDKLTMLGPFDKLRSFDKLTMLGPFDKLRAN